LTFVLSLLFLFTFVLSVLFVLPLYCLFFFF
jgi:hypothetical protein